jgi:hypothetical protein
MPRPKGSPNKITAEIKERLSEVIMDAMSSIDIDSMTQNEKLKLIQLGLPYIVTKPQIEEPPQEQQKFQIEIIDRLDKHKDRDLDKAIMS